MGLCFLQDTKWAISAWRRIHGVSLSFILSDSEGSIFLLTEDLPKLEQGEKVQQNYGKKAGWHKQARKL